MLSRFRRFTENSRFSWVIKSLLVCSPVILCSQEENWFGNPSFPICESLVGMEVVGEALYVCPLLEGLSYAIRNDVRQQSPGGGDGTPGGPVLDVISKLQPGFRIALSYIPDVTTRCVWMRFTGENEGSAHSELIIPGLGLEGTWMPAIDSLVLYQTASLRWNIQLNTLDLELGKRYEVSPNLSFNPACGVRIASIDQSFHAVYELPLRNSDQVHATNDFFSAGVRFLLDSEWSLFSDWMNFARGAIALLYGQFKTHYDFSLPSPLSDRILEKVNAQFYRLEPNGEFSIGVGWKRCLSRRHFQLGFRIGYEAQIFWGQNQLQQPLGSDAPALALQQVCDLAIQGFTFRGQIAF